MRIDPIVNKRVTRENLYKLRPWVTRDSRQPLNWVIEPSLREGELIQLARRYPESSQLLQFIAMHPSVGARGLREIVRIALERDDERALNGVVTLQKAPIDLLRKLRRHPSPSVREHVRVNIEWRKRRRRRHAVAADAQREPRDQGQREHSVKRSR